MIGLNIMLTGAAIAATAKSIDAHLGTRTLNHPLLEGILSGLFAGGALGVPVGLLMAIWGY